MKGAGDGITNVVDGSVPNHTRNEDNEDMRRERIADWVVRRFNAGREDIHVATNYSCQEIPTQTVGDSSQCLPNSETLTDARKTWGDEFEEVENTNVKGFE